MNSQRRSRYSSRIREYQRFDMTVLRSDSAEGGQSYINLIIFLPLSVFTGRAGAIASSVDAIAAAGIGATPLMGDGAACGLRSFINCWCVLPLQQREIELRVAPNKFRIKDPAHGASDGVFG